MLGVRRGRSASRDHVDTWNVTHVATAVVSFFLVFKCWSSQL